MALELFYFSFPLFHLTHLHCKSVKVAKENKANEWYFPRNHLSSQTQ